jgi:exopolysaccharide biosynthesis protein
MRLRAGAAAILATIAIGSLNHEALADFAKQSQSDPHVGIHLEVWKDPAIPAMAHVARIDLTNAKIQLVATKPTERGKTTSEFAALKGAVVAINGDSFAVGTFQPTGLAKGQSDPTDAGGHTNYNWWPNTTDDGTSAVFNFVGEGTPTSGDFTVAQILSTGLIVTQNNMPKSTLGVISGRPLLVNSGFAVADYDCSDAKSIPCDRAPRSAVALSNDGRTLWLVVVDGWVSTSSGVKAVELAHFLSDKFQVDMAMALDGGSSSTLYEDGNVVSALPDGVERQVANHLAVLYNDQLELGSLIGLICEDQINPCSPFLPGATVTIDTGGSRISAATSGEYLFDNRVPRYTCVHVTLPHYYPSGTCVVVGPGPDKTYGSVALTKCPGGNCPIPSDAGVPTDGPVEYPDAPPRIDAGGLDAGNGLMGNIRGGCCDAGPDHPPVLVCLLVAWWLTRRRVTTA